MLGLFMTLVLVLIKKAARSATPFLKRKLLFVTQEKKVVSRNKLICTNFLFLL
jgi:hypothetical protein